MVLGYIVSDSANTEDYGYVKYVKDSNNCKDNLPILVVGLEKAKEYAVNKGIKFDILNNTFSDGNMWTFKKTEKRDMYEECFDKFKEYVISSIIKKTLYYYINVGTLTYSQFKKLYNIIVNNSLNKEQNCILIDRDMLYCAIGENKVMGISFQITDYLNIGKDKIIDKLKTNPRNKILYTTSKKMLNLRKLFNGNEFAMASLMENVYKKEI
jgi:hypothetical protein